MARANAPGVIVSEREMTRNSESDDNPSTRSPWAGTFDGEKFGIRVRRLGKTRKSCTVLYNVGKPWTLGYRAVPIVSDGQRWGR